MASTTRRSARAAATGFAAILLLGGVPAAALAAPGGEQGKPQPAVPAIDWGPCADGSQGFDCATIEVPTDYDDPYGRTTTIGLTRLPATDPAERQGSLFLNFGGPGGEGVSTLHAIGGSGLFDASVLAHYDLVAFDPRAVGTSDPATCFATQDAEAQFAAGAVPFPAAAADVPAYLDFSDALARSCKTYAKDRIAHASTANVARDMDLLRQAVGDDKLHYVGYSYGTVLGATYAELFPGTVGSMVLDGTLDPEVWSGVGSKESLGVRTQQAKGLTRTFGEFTRLCREAGPTTCALASLGDPDHVVDATYAALRAHPLEVPLGDGTSVTLRYQDVVSIVLQFMYEPSTWTDLDLTLASVAVTTDAVPMPATAPNATLATPAAAGLSLPQLLKRAGYTEDYHPSIGGSLAAVCADGTTPGNPTKYAPQVAALEAQYPVFGAARGYTGLECDYLHVKDSDAYTGPWQQTTQAPVLVIGTTFDPATVYEFTRPYTDRFPNGRMLTVNGWGHTTVGKSTCANHAIARYLVDGEATDGATCNRDVTPFQAPAVPLSATLSGLG